MAPPTNAAPRRGDSFDEVKDDEVKEDDHRSQFALRRAALSGLVRSLDGADVDIAVPPKAPPAIARVIAHIGVGGFSRSHLSYATDRLLRSSPAPWGITGVGLMPWDAKMCKTLRDQDMLYTLVMQDDAAKSARVVEAITDFVFVPEDTRAFETLALDPRLKIISLTVTEKGYYQDVATGDLDLGAELVARDVDDWRSAGRLEKPRTAFGFICAVLHRVEINRWFGGSPPNFRTLYLDQIEVDSADFWTNRLLSSSSRSSAEESGAIRSITLTLKSG